MTLEHLPRAAQLGAAEKAAMLLHAADIAEEREAGGACVDVAGKPFRYNTGVLRSLALAGVPPPRDRNNVGSQGSDSEFVRAAISVHLPWSAAEQTKH